jgi:hypothetical protein
MKRKAETHLDRLPRDILGEIDSWLMRAYRRDHQVAFKPCLSHKILNSCPTTLYITSLEDFGRCLLFSWWAKVNSDHAVIPLGNCERMNVTTQCGAQIKQPLDFTPVGFVKMTRALDGPVHITSVVRVGSVFLHINLFQSKWISRRCVWCTHDLLTNDFRGGLMFNLTHVKYIVQLNLFLCSGQKALSAFDFSAYITCSALSAQEFTALAFWLCVWFGDRTIAFRRLCIYKSGTALASFVLIAHNSEANDIRGVFIYCIPKY